jgi:ATP-dependent RNA helicase DeaD
VVLLDVRARRRMQRLLSRAGIEASWDPVPDAAEVAAVLEKREHERLAAALAQAPDPSRVQLNEAEAMLAEAEPVDLVARLIGLLQRRSTTRPRSVRAVAPEPPVREDRGGAPRPGPGPAVGARTRARHEPGAAMVRFHVNWGHQGGATPQRLVALLCRRGRINSRALGSIDVGPFFSTFDVARSSAESFEEAAARPDARDPRIRIRRWKPKSPRHDGPGEDRPRPKRSTGVFKSTKTRL